MTPAHAARFGIVIFQEPHWFCFRILCLLFLAQFSWFSLILFFPRELPSLDCELLRSRATSCPPLYPWNPVQSLAHRKCLVSRRREWMGFRGFATICAHPSSFHNFSCRLSHCISSDMIKWKKNRFWKLTKMDVNLSSTSSCIVIYSKSFNLFKLQIPWLYNKDNSTCCSRLLWGLTYYMSICM